MVSFSFHSFSKAPEPPAFFSLVLRVSHLLYFFSGLMSLVSDSFLALRISTLGPTPHFSPSKVFFPHDSCIPHHFPKQSRRILRIFQSMGSPPLFFFLRPRRKLTIHDFLSLINFSPTHPFPSLRIAGLIQRNPYSRIRPQLSKLLSLVH